MLFSEQVRNYSVYLMPNNMDTEGRIDLECSGGVELIIRFVREGTPLGKDDYNERTKVGLAFERIDGFSRYVDLLRHHQPIWVNVHTKPKASWTGFCVYVNQEPLRDKDLTAG